MVVSIQKETALIKTLQNNDVAQKLNCLKEKNQTKTRKKSMPPHLIIMDKVVLLGVIFFLKMKCVCKTQMMPPPDHQNPVDMHTSIMCINILQNIKAVSLKL